MKVIQGSFSVRGIKSMVKQLNAYRNDLKQKTEQFVTELANAGIPVIDRNMSDANFTYDENGVESGSDSTHLTQVVVNSFGTYAQADLILQGSDILFIEFGAGVHYNGSAGTSPHPKGQEFGYVIGSYGKGNGQKHIWGYYADSGELVLTHGTKATMPVFKAQQEIVDKYISIAQKVFGGG